MTAWISFKWPFGEKTVWGIILLQNLCDGNNPTATTTTLWHKRSVVLGERYPHTPHQTTIFTYHSIFHTLFMPRKNPHPSSSLLALGNNNFPANLGIEYHLWKNTINISSTALLFSSLLLFHQPNSSCPKPSNSPMSSSTTRLVPLCTVFNPVPARVCLILISFARERTLLLPA